MKKAVRISQGISFMFSMLIISSCIKEKPTLPLLSTTAATEISYTTATSGGIVTDDGGASITAEGICWNTSADPTIMNSKTTELGGLSTFTSNLTQLTPNTLYFVRAYAANSSGTGYGNQVTFTTLDQAPAAGTSAPSNIAINTVTLNGTVNPNNLSTIVTFEYGTTISYGSITTATQSPITGNTNTNVSANLRGLLPETQYHFRLKAENAFGIKYGSDITFITLPPLSPITDIEGNTYKVVLIGTQVWMAENLKTTKYRNGDLIGTTSPATLNITSEITPKYQWAPVGDELNVATYGRLYTWHAATDTRNVCPSGWHVPTDAEWTILTDYLGGEGVSGDKLREIGTSHWTNPNGTNEVGFTALPSGGRAVDGTFTIIGCNSDWWTDTDDNATNTWHRGIWCGTQNVYRYYYYDLRLGLSIRCLKD